MKSYLDLLRHVMALGESHDDRTGVGTRSIFGYQWRHCLKDGFPILTTKRIPFRWVAKELSWFLSGSSNEGDLRKMKVDIWKEWATPEQTAKFKRQEGDLGPVYGPMWRRYPVGVSGADFPPVVEGGGMIQFIDQITALVSDIQNDPNSRRLIVTGWHPYYQRRVALPPCHTFFQAKVHPALEEGTATIDPMPRPAELSLHLYMRSADSFLGVPFNIASYALLCHLLASVCRIGVRDLIISFGDLHLYNNHEEAAQTQIARYPRTLPTLTLPPGLRGTGIEGLLAWKPDQCRLENYDPCDPIAAPIAV